MMATVQVDEKLVELMDEKIAHHGYADVSSYVRDLIRRDEARAEWLRQELQKGLDSGVSLHTVEEAIDAGFERARRRCG